MPYSQRFAAATTVAGTASTVFTCPANFVAVVRDLQAYNSGGASDALFVALVIPGPATLTLWHFAGVAASTSDQWQGRVVLNAGDQLELFSAAEAFEVLISGYLLSSP